MANIFDSEFVDINSVVLRRISGVLPFDVYVRRGDNTYTRIFPRGEALDRARIVGYENQKNVHTFYINKSDYKQYLLYVERVAEGMFKDPKKATSEEMLQMVKEMTDLTMLELIVNKQVDEKSVSHAATTMKGCVDLLNSDPTQLLKIFQLMTRHPYMMKHSISTSIFSLMLARLEKLESDRTLTCLGIGALLHDLGMSMISFDAEEKTELTPEEWKEVRRHPELGKRMLDSIKGVPMESRTIVLQHHEQPNGNGYPNGLHGKEIYYPAKIVSIADSFSALLTARPYRPEPMSPVKAIEVMNADRGKFDPPLLDNFSRIFITVG